MKVKRILSKKLKKEKGVSEVLGSILVLLITVMLFSTVFYYVSSLPTPKPRIYAQFDANMKIEQGAAGYYLNITVKNVGGESLVDWRTMFIVVIDFTAKQHMLSWINFSKQVFDKDGKFSQGESFYYNSSWDGFVYDTEDAVNSLNVGITLMDKNTGSIIWSSKLQGRTKMAPVLVGLTTSPSPPILGRVSTFKAIIFNPNNGGDVGTYRVYLDFSDSVLKYTVEGSAVKTMNYAGHNAFTAFVNLKNNESLNILKPYPVKVSINNGISNISYTTHIYVSRGTQTKGPDLYIDPSLITLSTLSPTHGDHVQVSVTVENLGGTGAKFQLRVLDKYSGYGGEIYIKTNLGSSEYLPTVNSTYTVAAAGQTTISFIWEDVGADAQGNTVVSKVSGTHQLMFQIVNVTPVENPDKYPDTANVELTVLPSMLLVDDDGYAEGSALDTSRYYKYYLDTAGYKYTVDKSSVDLGQLKNDIYSHDLVIWETGYKESPLTSTQASILQDYVANKGGALWLISQEISQSNLRTVLGDYSITTIQTHSIEFFNGIPNTPINLTLPNRELITDRFFNRDGAPDGNDTIYFSSTSGIHTFIEGNTSTSTTKYPIGVYKEFSAHGKIVFTGFELSRIKHYYSQDFIAYRILKWLANITGRAGNDLAVEDMIITPREPLYKQPVHISVIVSNNGGSSLSSEVLLEVDGINTLNINTTNPNSTGTIPPDGGFVTVNFTWIPTQPGKHILTAIVDPYNRIKETNEENNIVNAEIVDTNVFVHFSTLVVYNSSQTYSINEKNNILYALNILGYKYKVLDTYSTLPEGYSDGNYFAQYNLVIWADAKIGNRDIRAIKDSMSNNPNTGQLFIGVDLASEISKELTSYLDIQFNSLESISSKSVLYGVNNAESISNGLSLIIQPTEMYNITANNGKALFTTYNAISAEYSSLEKYTSYYSQQIPSSGFGVISKVPVSGAKYGIIPFNVGDVVGLFGLKVSTISKPYFPQSQARAWLLFRLFRYFGFQSFNPELATFTSDIQVIYGGNNPNLPPIIGRSYMLRTKVYNYGSAGANAIVRFYDDFEWIGSKTVYVPSGKYAQVEIAWTPMFASVARHIRIIVDPLNEVQETKWNGTAYRGKEIFNFNNEAIKAVGVYYFWDDMENGAGNWDHEATLVNINGETPLDFLARKDVDTNVIGDWDWSLSGVTSQDYDVAVGEGILGSGIYMTNDPNVTAFTHAVSHTQTAAYWLPETPGRVVTKRNVDVIITFDVSGSMSWDEQTRLYAAKAAGGIFVDTLHDNDRIALAKFNTESYLVDRFTSNYGTIRNAILALYPGGGTAFLDSTAASVRYAAGVPSSWSWAHNFNHDDHNDNNFPAAIVLTDGQSNSDKTFTTYQSCINEITKYDVALFTIAFGGDADRANMWRLAYAMNHTGRQYANYSMHFNVSTANELIEAFKKISQIIQQGTTGGVRTPPHSDPEIKAGKGITTVYTEDFESGGNGWSAGGTRSTWAVGQPSSWVSSAHGGSKCAATNLGGEYSNGENSWLRSPQIDLTAYANMTIKLSFWAAYDFYQYSEYAYSWWREYDYYDHVLVEISQDGGNTWSIVHSFPDENGNSNGRLSSWTHYEIDISSYAGKVIYLRFKMQDDDNDVYPSSGYYGNDRNYGIYIDDIAITAESTGGGGESGYSIVQERYRFLVTPPVRVGTPYLSFWNYKSGSYSNGDTPDHIVVIDYENQYYWLYDSSGAVAYEGNFLVLENNSNTGDGGPLSQAPVTYIENPTAWKDSWFRIKDHYEWRIFHLPAVPHAKRDFLFAWEDLWGTTDDIDADGDEWVRVTLLEDDTFRIVPYRAKGGYEHDFFIGSQFAYQKPHGSIWINSPDGGINLYEMYYAGGQHFPVYLRKAKGAILSFWTKYWMTEGTNGGFIYLWGSTDGVHWVWDSQHRVYIKPKEPYTGNLMMGKDSHGNPIGVDKDADTGGLDGLTGLRDMDKNLPYWCFNGRSGGGTFSWEYVEADLSPYIRTFKEIRIVFVMAQYGGIDANTGWHPEMGWYIDDVKVKVIGDGIFDLWRLDNLTASGDVVGAHSEDYAWVYSDTHTNGNLPQGIDASLITKQIDLSTARTAKLDFYIRFNLNPAEGLPPATVRVEISDDNGMTWNSITYGVRIGWGASGTGGMAGTLDSGTGYGWVNSGTLARINCDLSGWAGHSIFIRFRVVTNATTSQTWDPSYSSKPHGVFLDDVVVYGEGYASTVSGNYLWESAKSVSSSVKILKSGQQMENRDFGKKQGCHLNFQVVNSPHLHASHHTFYRHYIVSMFTMLYIPCREPIEMAVQTQRNLFLNNVPF